ncbi:MAG: bifunctional UDP-N-acetylglucosamine pyrophosphorylase / glucosamine-phosphate N-acetyltransferase [Actinomycetota bacterium]|nr:bifunctional UDP-N-acetylglucosamine pyrophosphorylase / glucosamine-phosphate N-acetyltransferase [Actinomycetota bacterium]
MRSSTPKVLHRIGGRSLLGHALVAAASLRPEHLVVVVRHERDRVAEHVTRIAPDVVIADQDDVKGTGRAVQCGLEALPADPSGTVVVTYGDVPLLTGILLDQLVEAHETAFAAVTVLTARVADPTGYGRIVRDETGAIQGIVEHKDATPEQRGINEINSGIYAFDAKVLADALSRITTDNSQGELYLTDVLAVARGDGRSVFAHATDDVWQVEGVNDRVQLAAMGRELNRRVLTAWMRLGVTVVDPATTWVDAGVVLDQDVTVLPDTHLQGSCRVATGATLGPGTTLVDCEVGPGATVVSSYGNGAVIGAGAAVGPFSHLRPGTTVADGGTVRSFVETEGACG